MLLPIPYRTRFQHYHVPVRSTDSVFCFRVPEWTGRVHELRSKRAHLTRKKSDNQVCKEKAVPYNTFASAERRHTAKARERHHARKHKLDSPAAPASAQTLPRLARRG